MPRPISRRPRQRGLTVVEVVIATALLVVVIGGAFRLLETTRDLAVATSDQHIADARVDRALMTIERDFRSASLGTAQHLDGSELLDGDSGNGLSIRPIVGWQGAVVLGNSLEYRLDTAAGATEGELIRTDGAIQTTIATGITAFRVTRTGPELTFELTARSGPDDDRGRTATGTLTVAARNP